jgi:hypothetical protein
MDFVQFNALTPAEKQSKVQAALVGAFSFLAKSARPFRATVKQINTEKLESRSRDLLNACFPDFLGQQEVADWYARGE